jgi:hypothetical protein
MRLEGINEPVKEKEVGRQPKPCGELPGLLYSVTFPDDWCQDSSL